MAATKQEKAAKAAAANATVPKTEPRVLQRLNGHGDGLDVLSQIPHEQAVAADRARHESFVAAREDAAEAAAAAKQAEEDEALDALYRQQQEIEAFAASVAALPEWKRAMAAKKLEEAAGYANAAPLPPGIDWTSGTGLTEDERAKLIIMPAWKRSIALRKRARAADDTSVAAAFNRAARVAEQIAEKEAEHEDDASPAQIAPGSPEKPQGEDGGTSGAGRRRGSVVQMSMETVLAARRETMASAEMEADSRTAAEPKGVAGALTTAFVKAAAANARGEEVKEADDRAEEKSNKTTPVRRRPKKPKAHKDDEPAMIKRRSVTDIHEDVRKAAKADREHKAASLRAARLIQTWFRRWKKRREERLAVEAAQLRKIQLQAQTLQIEAETDRYIQEEQRAQLLLIQEQRAILEERIKLASQGVRHSPGGAVDQANAGYGRGRMQQKTPGYPSGMLRYASPSKTDLAAQARKEKITQLIKAQQELERQGNAGTTGVQPRIDGSTGLYIVDGTYVNKDGSPAQNRFG